MRYAAATFCCIIFLFSCATTNEQFASLERSAAAADYNGALTQLESEKDSLYKKTDRVLYLMDSGLLAHYAQEYPQSNIFLSEAERQIYDYYAKSVSQAIGSAIVNDTIIDYAGEDYEDIYTNVFMALNYIHQNNIEAAMVEIRRFDNKLKSLSVKYRDQILQAQKEAQTESPSYEVQFNNSAFARYLSMILYHSQGDVSAAEVDLRLIASAFKNQPQLYDFPLPANIQETINFPPEKARLNLVSLAGLSPIKETETLRLPFRDFYFKMAIPVMKKRFSPVDSVSVQIKSAETQAVLHEINLDLLESIENIVIDTFKQRQSLIYFKTFARATVKAAASGTFGAIANETSNANASLVFSLLDFGSRIFTEASEQADTRISRFFPARVYAGGIALDPGIYSVSVQYKDKKGRILFADEQSPVEARAGRQINLLESYFLR